MRLTTTNKDLNREMICRNEDCGVTEEHCPHLMEDECACLREVVSKLAKYEDLEEQGLLLRLPCKVGDKVWVIDIDYEQLDSQKKKVYEAEWVRVNYVQTKEEGSFELRGEIAYQVHDYFYEDGRTMRQGMYVGQSTTKIGERVFLTREEAESALVEKGGSEC